MSSLEETLSQVLGNPQMMQQIMTLAQSLGPKEQEAPKAAPIPMPDPAMMQGLAGLAGMGTIDKEQKALITALEPYISRERRGKLERAMRAARMAAAASEMILRR